MNLGLGCTFNYIGTVDGIARYRLMLTRRATGLPARITFDALVNEGTSDPTIVIVREGETNEGIVTRGRAKMTLKELDTELIEDLGTTVPGAFTVRTDTDSVISYVGPRAARFAHELGLVSK